jgi:hypothetical protein
MREEFEKAFPVPHGVYWHEENSRYQRNADYPIRDIAHNRAWEAWQAATALQAERVRELEEALNGLLSVISETRGAPAHDAVQSALKALSATAREVGE